MNFKTRRDEDDGFWEVDSILQRTHTFSSEPAMQNLCRNSCVISRGKSRFKCIFPTPKSDQVQNYSVNLRNQKKGKPCLTKWNTSNHDTGTVHVTSPTSIKETCADTLSISPSVFLHTRNTSYDQEEVKSYSYQFFVWRSSVNSGLKKGTRMVRHDDQDERQSHASHHWNAVSPILLKALATHGARDFSDEQWLRLLHEKEAAIQDSSTARIPKNPWLTFEQFKDTLVEYHLTLS